MRRGTKSFLTTRPADTVLATLLKLFREEAYVKMDVAARLGVTYTTLWRWLREHPKQAQVIEKLRCEFLAQEIE